MCHMRLDSSKQQARPKPRAPEGQVPPKDRCPLRPLASEGQVPVLTCSSARCILPPHSRMMPMISGCLET